MATAQKHYEIVMRFELLGAMSITRLEQSGVPIDQLAFSKNEPMYRDHLERLGLLRYDMEKPMEPIYAGGKQTGGRNFLIMKLTELGAALMRASGFPPHLPI
jgi:hypothetical protein